MAIFTNRYNLPDAFYRAVVNDLYDNGGSDFTATSLQRPPRATVLMEGNPNIEIDVSTRVASLLGQGTHSILERACQEDDLIESRFFTKIMGLTISAQIDLYEHKTYTLSDWKTTKTFAFHKKAGPKSEWIQQLNLGAYLMRQEGYRVEHLRIIGILKDWDFNKAKIEPGYPPTEVMTLEIEIWPEEQTLQWIIERITAVTNARIELPKCTSKDTWSGRRCERFCDANSVCEQYQNSKKTGLL